MITKKEIITKYIESINDKIKKSPRDYKLQIERSILQYELHKIQPETYKLQPAIISYRRAFTYKNNEELPEDPLHKKSFEEKEKRYIKILSQIDSKQIDSLFKEKTEISEDILPKLDPEKIEYILNPQIGNNLFKDDKEIEVIIKEIEKEIKQFQDNSIDIKTQKNITDKIENLLNRNKEMKILEKYISILTIIESVILDHSLLIPEWYYLKGVFTLTVELRKNQIVSLENIYSIFNQGIDIDISKYKKATNTRNQEQLENQIAGYSESIIQLINCEQINNLETKKQIWEGAIETITKKSEKAVRELEYEDDNKNTIKSIERVKFLHIGDIYSAIKDYYSATKNYLEASKIKSPYSIDFDCIARIAKCLRFVEINDRKKVLENLSPIRNKNFPEGLYSYSYTFFKIGKYFLKEGIKESEKEKQKRFNENPVWFNAALECFNAALLDYSGQYQVEIILEKIKVLRRLGFFEETETLILRLLRIDQEKFYINEKYGYLHEGNYRYALELYLKIKFNQEIHQPNSLYSTIKYSEFIDLINTLDEWMPSYNQSKKKYHIREAIIYYTKALFIYKNKNFDFFEAENEQRLLERSFSLFKQAFDCLKDNSLIEAIKVKDPNSKDDQYQTKYFLLQIIEKIIEIGMSLKKYEEIRPYLIEGSEVLNIVIEDKKKKNIKISKNSNLNKTFKLIDQFRVSGFSNKKESIEQAEIRKNISLNNIFLGSKQLTKFSFDNVIKILKINTAIVYWHIDLIEINCYLLVKDKNKAEVKCDHLINITDFKKFKYISQSWNNYINKISQDPTYDKITEEEKNLSNYLYKLGKILSFKELVDQILQEASIKNIIIIPHRDLHGLPLHVLFNNYLRRAKRNYSLSFLPSIKIGLELNSNVLPDADMLMIHPSNESGKFLYHARTECTAINIKSHNTFLNQTRILEGDPDATWEEVEKTLKNCINYNYLHFLGHAHHNFEEPKKSNLKLTGTKHLTLECIQSNFDLSHFYLICLSACETGHTSPISPTEEYVGLVSAILAQGVSYVVSTLWRVEDMSSTLLMIKFYDELFIKKRHPIEALSKAQNWLKSSCKDDLIEWCKDQHCKLKENLNNISIIDSEELRDQMEKRLKVLKREANALQKLSSNKAPYKNPYYWAGFTITGIPK